MLTWGIHRRHVFRDLRPNLCTFADCQNAGKLYVNRHDWEHHEFQMHRREYACKECSKVCSSRKEMTTHLLEHCGNSISPSRLGVILDLCDRQIDIWENKDECLMCGEEVSMWALQGHLATHLEEIALSVLPSVEEEDDGGKSGASA